MNRKLLVYSLAGFFTGSAVTALIILPIFNPQANFLISSLYAQTSSSNNTPMMGGMMNEQHFIVMMIPHHEDAIAMADLALNKATHPEIKELAKAIKTTQTQEIEQMQSWYKQWYGTDVPNWSPGMGMNGMGMHRNRGNSRQNTQSGWQPGMGCMGMKMMQSDLTALANASDFDRVFIEEMIPHHQMGVMMTQMMLGNSDRPEMQKLAENIINAQTAEINQMQQWYQEWYQ
jgi:uncharacterized protein (DUF305 family)